jgi:hypothetical protein
MHHSSSFLSVCLCLSLFISSALAAYTLNPPAAYTLGAPVSVSYTVSSFSTRDTICAYAATDLNTILEIQYVTGLTGTAVFVKLPSDSAKDIVFKYFDAYNTLRASNVAAPCRADLTPYSLTPAVSSVEVGARIVVRFTSVSTRSDLDQIAMCDENGRILARLNALKSLSTLALNFTAPKFDCNQLHFRYYTNSGDELARSVQVPITISANITLPSIILINHVFAAQFNASAFHSEYDQIKCFKADNQTGSAVATVYVPAGASGNVLLLVTDTTVQTVICNYYQAGKAQTIIAVSASVNVTVQQGFCADTCSNSNQNCSYDSDCGVCSPGTSPACLLPPRPALDFEAPADNTFTVALGQMLKKQFTVSGTSSGIMIKASGLPRSARITQTQSGDAIVATLQYTPIFNDQSTSFHFCVAAIATTTGLSSEESCFWIKVSGKLCTGWGDPHFITYDGTTNNFQSIGDFTVAKSITDNSLHIQSRFMQCNPNVACIFGLAVRDQMNAISILHDYRYKKMNMTVNSQTVELSNLQQYMHFELPGDIGEAIVQPINLRTQASATLDVYLRSGLSFRVVDPFWVYSSPRFQFLAPSLSYYNNINGLCGNWGKCENNCQACPSGFRSEAGVCMPVGSALDKIFSNWGVTWKTSLDESLFDYNTTGNLTPAQLNSMNSKFVPLIRASTDNGDLQTLAFTACSAFNMTDDLQVSCRHDIIAMRSLDPMIGTLRALQDDCMMEKNNETLCKINAECPDQCAFMGKCNATTQQCNCFLKPSDNVKVLSNCTIVGTPVFVEPNMNITLTDDSNTDSSSSTAVHTAQVSVVSSAYQTTVPQLISISAALLTALFML